MIMDVKQLRAALGLLNWENADLAKKAEVQANTISFITNEKRQARQATMEKIQKIFEEEGIEFLPDSGVRLKSRVVTTHEGPDANKLLIEDLYNTLQAKGGEILTAHLDEGNSIRDLDLSWIAEQIRKRKEAGITHRMIVQENDPNLIPPFDNYHCVPEKYFSQYPLFVYGSKLALLSWEPSPRVVIIDDARFADSARKLFEFMWDKSKPVER